MKFCDNNVPEKEPAEESNQRECTKQTDGTRLSRLQIRDLNKRQCMAYNDSRLAPLGQREKECKDVIDEAKAKGELYNTGCMGYMVLLD
ncbi:hypothetical protein J3458_020671 [Metarhizium acridum]|uniref:uncharacterized protein n=1 Tax=Metarhizium acridum TaxID=92637 RepID=UPI001C6B5CA3|nr:hypothetical protein J3458_020671 [Metarhizium acridum]